jgi:hypothetical protein
MSALAEVTDADRAAIRHAITAQMEAFRRDAADEAFSFAAPAIRAMFGTPENFLRMAREQYAPVYRSKSTVFGALLFISDEPTQEVIIVDADGKSVLARYLMQKQPEGAWKILGCILLPVPGTAT